uniref:Uncharacterized protein n=1 Tax=Arundo donax TaxID=35708 RepID=A0A0A9G0U4_ARUDO
MSSYLNGWATCFYMRHLLISIIWTLGLIPYSVCIIAIHLLKSSPVDAEYAGERNFC